MLFSPGNRLSSADANGWRATQQIVLRSMVGYTSGIVEYDGKQKKLAILWPSGRYTSVCMNDNNITKSESDSPTILEEVRAEDNRLYARWNDHIGEESIVFTLNNGAIDSQFFYVQTACDLDPTAKHTLDQITNLLCEVTKDSSLRAKTKFVRSSLETSDLTVFSLWHALVEVFLCLPTAAEEFPELTFNHEITTRGLSENLKESLGAILFPRGKVVSLSHEIEDVFHASSWIDSKNQRHRGRPTGQMGVVRVERER